MTEAQEQLQANENDELSEFEHALLTFLVQHYSLTAQLMSAEMALKEYGIPISNFKAAMSHSLFKEALEERGIVFERFRDDWTAKSLTPVQLLAANSLLDLTDSRTQKKKLQDLGVATTTYNAWLKDPVFKDYIHRRAEQLIGDNKHEVDTALLDRVRAGDLKAIEYYNEMTGRFVRQRSGVNNGVDVYSILVKVIELIDEHVTDADAQMAISNGIKRLIGANNLASAMVSQNTFGGTSDPSTTGVPLNSLTSGPSSKDENEDEIVVPTIVSITKIPDEFKGLESGDDDAS